MVRTCPIVLKSAVGFFGLEEFLLSACSPLALSGYCDPLSARPGESIAFKLSKRAGGDVSTRLVRLFSVDANPDGPGMEIVPQPDFYPPQTISLAEQALEAGSYGQIENPCPKIENGRLSLGAVIWPTLPDDGRDQTILSIGDLRLGLNAYGSVTLDWSSRRIETKTALVARRWYRVKAEVDVATGDISVQVENSPLVQGQATPGSIGGAVLIAAHQDEAGLVNGHFDGKIEAPFILQDGDTIAHWDFSQQISSTRIMDVGSHSLHGHLVNYPARGMVGSNWTAREMCWRHAPKEYGAIHFHSDDLYDAAWNTDVTFQVPTGMPSGCYGFVVSDSEGHEETIPFFVRPPLGQRTAALCVLVSTVTYAIYGNHSRPDFRPEWRDHAAAWGAYPHNPKDHPELGLSTYNLHRDGSGICHASHLRPLLTLRPGYITFGPNPDQAGGSHEGSGLRHFQADSHLLSWLNAKGIPCDLVTDHDLHREGVAALEGYQAVLTGTHPEYHTVETLDALQTYRDTGGRFGYLGGNGFYWKVARHPENTDIIEVRRAEGGIRAWASDPGEYYHAFDGSYGGLWRRNGRPPQSIGGVGFSAQGTFRGTYYRRTNFESAHEWLFKGIEGDRIGEEGLCGGGAAGFELDRWDPRLGSPEEAVVLARSEGCEDAFVVVPEELLTHITTVSGESPEDLIRAEIIYADFPGGGALFATGSITFCGALPINDFENAPSRLMENLLERWLNHQ